MSPFAHREDIMSVEPLRGTSGPKSSLAPTIGATVKFRAIPGMTAEWFQRVLSCHIARAASVGHDMPEMSYGPVVPKGVSTRVTSTVEGFAVAIVAEDSAGAEEVLRRAQQLVVTH